MSHLKSFTLISFLSFSLFSCASKPLDVKEANLTIANIETKLNDSTFDFPTKITIQKLIKKNDNYIDKLVIRFSLDDNYIYYSDGFDEKSINEHWDYLDKKDNKIYHFTSIAKDNSTKKYYKVSDYDENSNFFIEKYTSIKDLVISECDNFKKTLDDCESLASSDNDSTKIKLLGDKVKNIELTASIIKEDEKLNATQSFENYLPKVSKIYKASENKEEKNFETNYYYNGVNITRPNIHNFTLKK